MQEVKGMEVCRQGCRMPREHSPPPGDFSQQMSLFTHQIKTLPGSKGPLEKGTAGYYLKMKYAASEEHFHSGMRGRAVCFYKDGMGWKLAVNLEESCACSSPLAWHCHTWNTALRWAAWGGWEPLRVEEESLSCSH